jgi:hypothetical protein
MAAIEYKHVADASIYPQSQSNKTICYIGPSLKVAKQGEPILKRCLRVHGGEVKVPDIFSSRSGFACLRQKKDSQTVSYIPFLSDGTCLLQTEQVWKQVGHLLARTLVSM